jgi:hypothetical protein
MKKFLKITGIIILVLFITLITAPFLFKDKIKAWVQNDIDKMINAELYFSSVDLSFIRNFPDARISINDFGVIGEAPFAGDTLAAGKSFNLVVDIMSVISGDEIGLKKIILDQPSIHAIVLKDGTANWDIMAPDTTTAVPEEAAPVDSGNINIKLNEYRLNDARIIYDDATLPMRAEIIGLNHSGSGNFTLDIYDLVTTTTAERLTVVYDGINYLNKIKLDADVNMKIDMENDLRIDLQNNTIAMNDLEVGLEGWVAMPGDDINMDLVYAAKNTSFKSILSLVPGVYTESFGDIKADGNLVFDGGVKGTYNETRLPGFFVNLNVDNATIQYPDVPKPITGINMDMKVNNEDGDLENTVVDIQKLHADFGSNPIDAKMRVKGLENIEVNGYVKADLNLAEIMTIYPVEGTDLSGIFKLDATANGTYSETKGTFPKVKAVMDMSEGYVKNAEYPAELTQLNFHAELLNEDGSLEKSVFDVPNFSFNLDGEPIAGKAHVENFDNPNYQVSASGSLDLEKLMQVYPIDSMTLKGKMIVDQFSTRGRYSDIEAENYTALASSGTVKIQNLEYTDYYLPQAVTVESGQATFTPSRLEFSNAKGKLGSSDYEVSGYFSNYMAYALMDNQILKGNMKLDSKKMDLNEWMVEEASGTATTGGTTTEEEELEVFPVPDNLDIIFDANIGQVIYDNLKLNNLKGKLEVVNEEVDMEGLSFELLGSQIAMNGIYNTENIDKPAYSFYLDVKNLGIKEAFNSFETMQSFAPVLKAVEGIANGKFGISGILQKNMMPVLEEINSLGLFEMQSGKLSGSNVMNALADKTKIDALRTVDLGNIRGNFKIENGFLEVSPIALKIGNVNLTIGGKQSLTGELAYLVNLDAPSGTLGQSAFTALSNLSGNAIKASERVTVNLLVGGTAQKPTIQGGDGGTGSEVKDQLTEAAEDKLKDKLGTDVNLEKDSLKAQVKDATQKAKDSLKNVANQTQKALQDSLKNALSNETKEVKDKIKDGVKEDLKGTLDDLKNKFGIPKKKKKKDGN